MENAKNCLHAYIGEGKGKTTCAVGLAVRHSGRQGRVLFTQFLKGNNSGELEPLHALPGVTLLLGKPTQKFSFAMDARERAEETVSQNEYLRAIDDAVGEIHPTLIVCDELLAAIQAGFVTAESAEALLRKWLEGSEVVVTGREAPENLLALADYVTEMRKVKHPYDQGLTARRGIEF